MFRKLFINTPKELLNRLVVWRIAKVSERNFLYLLAFVVGIFSGLAALLLKNLIHFVAHWTNPSYRKSRTAISQLAREYTAL